MYIKLFGLTFDDLFLESINLDTILFLIIICAILYHIKKIKEKLENKKIISNMSTVTVKHKDGTTNHFIDCRYAEKGDKLVIIHDEPDLENGGLMPSIQKIYDKDELESIKQED